MLGETVGPYRILGALGDGRLGHLYVAQQSEIRGVPRVVALRHVRPELAGSRRFRPAFQEVVRLATRCEHPNVVGVFEQREAGSADESCFLVIEYLPGENVESILQRCSSGQAMPPDIAAYVVKQAAAGLQAWRDVRETLLQSGEVPDADVRSSDVFVTHHGTVKWLPGGLRTLADEAAASDTDGWSAADAPGSLGDDGASTLVATAGGAERRRDVSSLGRLLWTCLVGRRQSSSAATFGAPASFAELGPWPAGVPEALADVVRRALALDSARCFESPAAIADELDRYLLRRESRPTPRQLRGWLEQLFGADRALLQLRVARGRDVHAALSHLGVALPPGGPATSLRAFSSPRPRELWLARHATFSQVGRVSIAPPRSFERALGSPPDGFSRVSPISLPPSVGGDAPPSTLGYAELPARSPARERSSRAAWGLAALAVCAGLALSALILVPQSHDGPQLGAAAHAPADTSHEVSVRSTPEGAAIFIDGEPTGLSTPAVLRGLVGGRTIRVRVEKAGFQSREQSIEVGAGSPMAPVFELSASAGQVHFIGVPANARVYVDDAAVVLGRAALELAVGAHTVRVESASELLFSGTVDVVPGKQTIRVGADRGP